MRKPRDWGQCCPNPDCSHYTLMSRGNVSSIARYLTASGKRRIFKCSKCEQSFSETRDTVFFDLKTTEERVMMALKMLLVKVDLSGISFVLGVKEETVLEWLRRAAEKVSLGSAGWGGGSAARKSSLPETKLLPDAGAVVLG